MNTGLDHYVALIAEKADIELRLSHLRGDLKDRQAWITPTGAEYKALGTTVDDCKNALQKLYLIDIECTKMRDAIRDYEGRLANVSAAQDQYEASRRDYEGTTARMLAEALHTKYHGHELTYQAAQAEAVGDALIAAEQESYQNEVDQRVYAEALYDAEIPF